MQIKSCWLSCLTIISICHVTAIRKVNTLNGKHLRVFAVEFPVSLWTKRNTSGHVIKSGGILQEHIDVLAEKLQFSYSFLPDYEPIIGDASSKRGAIYSLIRNEADYLLTTAVGTPFRYERADFPTYWLIGPFGFIVPYPKETTNFMASLEIFTYEVWVAIIFAIIIMISYLHFSANLFLPQDDTTGEKRIVQSAGRITGFVLGNILSQGQHFYSNRLIIRFAAGAWCVSCFFIVQFYSTTLISHLMSPHQKLIANNMHEIANTPGVSLMSDKGFALDLLLKSIQFGDYKKLGDRFKEQPDLLCNKTDDCLKRMREEGNIAFGAPVQNLKLIMKEDLQVSGFCHYYQLKETVLKVNVFTLLQKNSPYTDPISMMILLFHQYGLHDNWFALNLPNPQQCMQLSKERSKNLRRLSLTNLSSAFLILGAGYVGAFLILFFEKFLTIFFHQRNPVTQSN